MTKLADDFEQWFRLRVLMFGAAIELQIDAQPVAATAGRMAIATTVFTVFNWGQSRLALI